VYPRYVPGPVESKPGLVFLVALLLWKTSIVTAKKKALKYRSCDMGSEAGLWSLYLPQGREMVREQGGNIYDQTMGAASDMPRVGIIITRTGCAEFPGLPQAHGFTKESGALRTVG
jgi:hypothetical protein